MSRARIATLLLLIALLAVPVASAQAKDVYAGGAGTAANGCLSLADACTLEKAAGLAVNGDRVLVSGDDGPVAVPVTGVVLTQSVSLRSVETGGAKPVVTGAVPAGDAVIGFAGGNAAGSNVSGLDIRNTADAPAGPALEIGASDVVVQDSVLTSPGTALASGAVAPTIRRVVAHGGEAGAELTGEPLGDPATIVNSVLTADADGGTALRSVGSSTSVTAVNVTALATGQNSRGVVAQSQPVNFSGANTLVLRNSIARGTAADISAEERLLCLPVPPCAPGILQVDHSDFTTKDGTPTEGAGNVSADPGFVSATDLHLAATSALRDIGVDDPLSQPVDLDGSPRKDGTGVDIGAYEYLIPLPPKNPLPPVDAAAAPKDTTAPTLGVLRLSNASFRVGAKATALSAARRRSPVGTTVTTGVTERSTVLFEIDRIITGRKSAGDCVKTTAKALKRLKPKQRCRLALPVEPGLERVAVKPGRLTFAFSGRVGTQALPAGPYRMVAIATDAAGNRSAAQRTSFTILPPKKARKNRAR